MFFIEEKMWFIDLLKQFLKSMIIAVEWQKKHFNKILVMFERNEQKFQSSNKCWVCDKVRDHCHVTEKYRGSAH